MLPPPLAGACTESFSRSSQLTTQIQLKELFAEFNPTSAHVALRPIPIAMIKRLAARGEKRKGRGFGFVSFADAATQQKALQAMNGKTIGDRELAVKVAIDSAKHLEKAEAADSDASSKQETAAVA